MQLATRTQRLLAHCIDLLIFIVCGILALFPMASMPIRIFSFTVFMVLIVYQIFLLSEKGQTIGKMFFGIHIVLKDTLKNGGFVVNVLKRQGLNFLLDFIPGYFLVDRLFIFRDDRRCLHDMIAGTVVIRIDPPVVQ